MEAGASLYDFAMPIVTFGRGAALYRLTAGAMAPCDGERILDAACGTGLLTAAPGILGCVSIFTARKPA